MAETPIRKVLTKEAQSREGEQAAQDCDTRVVVGALSGRITGVPLIGTQGNQ